MVSFPNCKINLGLHIVEKRNDGYHNLETVFYPLPLTDILEILPDHGFAGKTPETSLTLTGLPVAGDPQTNLCLKAWHLLKQDFGQLPPVQMHLYKNIPMGAGLGGGSSDGAFTLLLLNEKFGLNLRPEVLAGYALKLGSDCPFFIYNRPAFATGRGELMKPLERDLSAYSFLLVNPDIHISTAQAFSRVAPVPAPVNLAEAIMLPVENWRELVRNDFEEPAFFYYPALKDLKKWLYDSGALYASMTGSGSCFYGIFPKNQLPGEDPAAGWKLHRIP
ncbi:4-(cytidine 5'-diphospho)-2-C-methyl-D-erythritol kinase [Flavitalea antarctica]